jgi:hypothetical protein
MRALSQKLGALRERDFRLLFTATTITTLGDRIASIALVFAVLAIGSATQLGLVLGARSLAEAARLSLVTWLGILLLPSVWAIGRQEPELQPTTMAA